MRVVCLEQRSVGVEEEVAATTEVVFVGPGLARGGKGLRREIKRLEPDLIHTTLFESDVLGRLASIATGIPVVSSFVNTSYEVPHGSNPDVPPLKLWMVRAIDGFTARHLVKRFHALTEASADSATRSLGVSRHLIDVIPRGRNESRLGSSTPERRSRVRSELGLEDEQPVLLSVGRREHQKGQIHAIEAMASISQGRPESVLLVAGRDGAASQRLHGAVISAGVERNVRFLGHRGDVPDLMAAADLLVFPSLYEGFGGTVIEAMALELPVVASDIPTLREVTAGAAELVPVGSSQALAETALRLLDNPEMRERLKTAGRHRFETQYTIDAVADRMAEFYASVTNKSSDL